MKISILNPDLSANGVGRSYLLAKILQRRYQVEIVGPASRGCIWQPFNYTHELNYKAVKVDSWLKLIPRIRGILNKITGDIIYANKPLLPSLGIGLLKKLANRKPLILDIDDWEMGFIREAYSTLPLVKRSKFLAFSAVRPHRMVTYSTTLLAEKLTRFANEITVSNSFLKRKFGGTVIWHGRDTDAFNPEKFDKDSVREKYGIGKSKRIVIFLGSATRYKGIEDLVEAASLLQEEDIWLILVGMDRDNYSQNLIRLAKEKLDERFKAFGLQPFENVPEFLAMADIVVIPQRNSPSTVGQVPAKVFDAMAMAKPIIATNVSDLPEILDGCGWVVEPERPEQLAQAIQFVFNHAGEAKEKGWKARSKCIEKYSWNAMEKVLFKIFGKYE